jgi:hypothetical protein
VQFLELVSVYHLDFSYNTHGGIFMNDVDFSGLIYYPDTGAFYRVKNPFMQIENVKSQLK